jgi:pyrroline-5-carboxylate reductase
MLAERRFFFLGAGAISAAMVRGLLATGAVPATHITVSARRNTDRVQALTADCGVCTSADKLAEVSAADIVVLAVKPHDVPRALHEVRPVLTARHLVASVAAGITTAAIEAALAGPVPVVRAMPNTSSRVRESATALAHGRWAGDGHLALAAQLFAAIGTVTVVPERMLDAVTGLAGTGPAYIYYVAEALLTAGQELGLDEQTSRALVLQTLSGAAAMLRDTGLDPAELRRQVTSPNGTTMAGIGVLDAAGVQERFVEAVRRAAARARELGQEAGA